MTSPPDVKPNIAGRNAPHTPTYPLSDIKPTPESLTKYKDSIDFTSEVNSIRQERERLEEKHQLHKSVLDLREEMLQVKEENRRLREARGVVDPEPGLTDAKPDISRFAGAGGGSSTLQKHAGEDVEGDDDDVIFVGETKSGTAKPVVDVKPGQCRRRRRSSDRASLTIALVPVLPNIPAVESGLATIESLTREPDHLRPMIRTDRTHQANPLPIPEGHTTPSVRMKRFGKRTRPPRPTSTRETTSSSDSSSSESESSDDYPRSSSRTVWQRYYGQKRKKIDRVDLAAKDAVQQRSKTALAGRSTPGSFRSKGSPPLEPRKAQRTERQTKTTSNKPRVVESDTDDQDSRPYQGPHLHVLSVQALNDRLTRSYQRRGMSTNMIIKLSGWWPKSSVISHHRLDASGMFLLTWAVHVWWSNLWNEVNSPRYKWPSGSGRSEKKELMSRVREVALIKEGLALRSERDMISADKVISPDSIIQLKDLRK